MITVTAVPGSIVAGRRVPVSGPEGHHLMVRRAEDRVELRVVDGSGTVGWGRLELSGAATEVAIERVERVPQPPSTILAAGAGDRDRFLGLVEKAVELGVTRVVPLETERSVSVATRYRDKHLEKLERRAQEAMKQSGNPWLPELAAPIPLPEFLAGPLPASRWLADREGRVPSAPAPDAALVIAVGPEGGFTDVERRLILDGGFVPVRLGPHTLRFDTAALAALTTAWQLRRSVSDE